MRMIIAGAGKVGRYLGTDLVDRGHDVLVVERSEERVDRLGQCDFDVMLGDACAPDVLERAGAREADVVVAATGDDEDNLVISLLAKQEFAVPRVLARVNHPVNEWLFDDAWGVDMAVSPPHLLTALVDEEVTEGDVVPLMKLQHGQVELMEARLDERSNVIGRRVGDLDLPPDAAVVAIVRNGRVVAARPTQPLEEGDEVIAIAAGDRHDELRRLLCR